MRSCKNGWRLVLCAGLALVASHSSAAEPSELRVMTFNIRYDNSRDGGNVWQLRRHMVVETIRVHRPDVVGLQEALRHQIDHLDEQLPRMAWFGEGRDGGARGEHSPIFYREDRLEIVEQGTFWLSRTPDRPSNDWGARLRRICTWGRLRDRSTAAEVFVFNTHFDHQSEDARRRSAELLLERIASLAGDLPAVLLGDLNCSELSLPYLTLVTGAAVSETRRRPELALRDAAVVSETPAHGPAGTWIGFGNAQTPRDRIDHVLVKNETRVLGYGVMAESWHGRTASDHLPVVADLRVGDGSVTRALQLRTGWRFQVDPEGRGRRQGFYEVGFDDSKWPFIRAGEPWEMQGFEHDGSAWYRKVVHIPESWSTAKIVLDVPGVDDSAIVYVDGHRVARLGDRASTLWNQRVSLQLPGELLLAGSDVLLAIEVIDARVWGGLIGYPVSLRTDVELPTHRAKGIQLTRVVDPTEIVIEAGGDPAVLGVQVAVLEGGHGWLRVGIGVHEGAVACHLIDQQGLEVRQFVTDSRTPHWFEHPCAENTQWTVKLTPASATEPTATACSVQVLVVHGRQPERSRPERVPRRPRHVPDEAVHFVDSWYLFLPEPMTFADARTVAAQKQATLLTIGSVEENDWIMRQIEGVTWLGVERIDGEWRILDARSPAFFLWDVGEPGNSPRERFAAIGVNVNGRWHDHLDDEVHLVCIEWKD